MKKLLISVLSLVTSATRVSKECMTKLNMLAGNDNDALRSTVFDWSDEILAEFHTGSLPVLKRSCYSEAGDLNSFRIVMRGYDVKSNILSNSAGPSELGTCSNKPAPVNDHPIGATLFFDDTRV